MSLARVAVVCLLAAVLSGCTDAESPAPRYATAEEGLQAFQGAAVPTDVGVNGMSIEATVDDEDLGSFVMNMNVKFGANGAFHVSGSMQAEGLSVEIDMRCNDEGESMSMFGMSGRSRPSPEGCQDEILGDDEMPGFNAEDWETEGIEFTTTSRGKEATIDDDGTAITIVMDSGNRLSEIHFDDEEGTGVATIAYGSPYNIELSETEERIPSEASCYLWAWNGEAETTCTGGDDAPLDEFHVRVMRDGQQIAMFPLEGGNQASGPITFSFTDNGNGLLGDEISVSGLQDDDEVIVWDEWADRDLEDNPIPGAPFMLLAGLIGLLAFLRRR